MTVLAVATLLPAPSPKAVLPWPVVFKANAPKPIAVLPLPSLTASALRPLAVWRCHHRGTHALASTTGRQKVAGRI
jgi:hypothetical protein